MFCIDPSPFITVRPKLLYEYQEQGSNLGVVFKGLDGDVHVSRDVLRFMSGFYSDQLDALDRFENDATFTCPVSHVCLKAFFDIMHGIRLESVSLVTILELMKFIMHLGKYESWFEKKLLDMLGNILVDAKLPIPTKLLISLVSNKFDNFNGQMEKKLFTNDTDTRIHMSLEDLKLGSEINIELIKMIPMKEGLEAEDEIASQVFLIARSLKRNKYTKQPDGKVSNQKKAISIVENSDQYAENVTFKLNRSFHHSVCFDVSLNQTVQELTDEVVDKFKGLLGETFPTILTLTPSEVKLRRNTQDGLANEMTGNVRLADSMFNKLNDHENVLVVLTGSFKDANFF